MKEQDVRRELINTLFSAFPRDYGATDEYISKRKAIYLAMLKDIPTEAIRLACRKAYLEEDRLPSIAKLVQATRSLLGDANEDGRIKEWGEAKAEIVKRMYDTPHGHKPKWSSPEIEQAVESFGWIRLQTIEENKFEIASAQIRDIYNSLCKRKISKQTNDYLLGGNSVLSLAESKQMPLHQLESRGGILTPTPLTKDSQEGE